MPGPVTSDRSDPRRPRPAAGPEGARGAHAAHRPRRPRLGRRGRLVRTVVILGAAAALAYAAVAVAGTGGRTATRAGAGAGEPGTTGSPRGSGAPRAPVAPTAGAHATTAPTTTTVPPTTNAGSLPQTTQFPSTADPQFQAEMDDLWQGIVTDSLPTAMPAFFPEPAYVQLKTLGDPAGDWQNRLVADYGLDIGAAHALLGPDPSAAQLVAVDVPAQYGHWVPPGVCDNGIGYFEVPNSRIVYQVNGQESSFGIASMISWRGQWYVVHLGAILRSGSGGEVSDPQSGPGVPEPSSTC